MIHAMRKHRFIWTLALAVLLAAGALAWLRQESANTSAAETLIEETLSQLENDPQMENAATQNLLRKAAVRIEERKLNGAKAAYLLAKQYIREHNMPAAETLLLKATELQSDWSLAWYELGTLLAKHSYGKTSEAEAALRKASELNPQWSRPHNGLAVLFRVLHRYPEAEEEAKRSLELDPNDVANHNNYANLLISLERFEEAERHYQKALALDPDRPKPLYNLACLYALMGKNEEAIGYLDKAIKLAPVLREDAWGDSDLDSLREIPEFRKLVYGAKAKT